MPSLSLENPPDATRLKCATPLSVLTCTSAVGATLAGGPPGPVGAHATAVSAHVRRSPVRTLRIAVPFVLDPIAPDRSALQPTQRRYPSDARIGTES